jgi:hypothetical protein
MGHDYALWMNILRGAGNSITIIISAITLQIISVRQLGTYLHHNRSEEAIHTTLVIDPQNGFINTLREQFSMIAS